MKRVIRSLRIAIALMLCAGFCSISTQAMAQGNLVSWGYDADGQVSGTPAGAFAAVAGGYSHSVALRADGTLVSWGGDNFGVVSGTPAGTFSAVAAGPYHNVAIRTDGTLASWGYSGYGLSNTPGGTFTAVSAGIYHSVAIRTDGTLVSWGYDSNGQVSGTPAGTFVAVAALWAHSVAIRTDGTLVSWGYDSNGQVSGTPAGTFSAVSAGIYHSVAIRTDGTLVTWGYGGFGLSNIPAGTFSAIAAGETHCVAIRTDGTLVSWGGDNFGVVSGTPAGTFSAVAAGIVHSVAICSPLNHAPSANAGADITVPGCSGPTRLNGSLSLDPDGDVLTYAWYEGNTLLATGLNPAVTLRAGAHTITLVVTDPSGVSSSDTVVVTVEAMSFDGFLSPIGGADATGGSFADPLRAFKLGSTIPIKFKITCCGTTVLTGIHTLQVTKYSSAVDSDSPLDATPTDAATTGNQFRLTGDQWHYNLNTGATGMSKGTWKIVATLSDASQHVAWVTIK